LILEDYIFVLFEEVVEVGHDLVDQSGGKGFVASKPLQLNQPVLQLNSLSLPVHGLKHFPSRGVFLKHVNELLEYVTEEDKTAKHKYYHKNFFAI
jgi:hypothetical protein